MSYQSRKIKKSKINRARFIIGLFFIKLFNKLKGRERRRKEMLFPVNRVMDFLRKRNKIVRVNNLRINEWVAEYLERCFMAGEPVNILTQWCLSKDLEERLKKQGGNFSPTKKERKLFSEEITQIVAVFKENGIRFNWWITFNRSYLDRGRINTDIEERYKNIIVGLAREFLPEDDLIFLGWEEEVLGGRPRPNEKLLRNFGDYISERVFGVETQMQSVWVREYAGLDQTNDEIRQDVMYKLACEVEEGIFLLSPSFPLSSDGFIIIPLEFPERYDNFSIFAKDLKKRIVSILSFYPWRMKKQE